MMGFGLLVPVLIFLALAYAFGWLPNQEPALSRHTPRRTLSALAILEERYARGEIDRTEYLNMRNDLLQ